MDFAYYRYIPTNFRKESSNFSPRVTNLPFQYGVSKQRLTPEEEKSIEEQVSYGVSKQRLTPEEEKSIENWVLEIQSWIFLPRVAHLREMAEELLQMKSDYKELGKNWSSGFFSRHTILQSK